MKKVLIIDDEPDWTGLLKKRLEHHHYAVAIAQDGAQGLMKIQLEKPDIIILDVTMPNMDGHTFLQECKAMPDFKNIPILVLTGKDGMKDVFKAEGVKGFIVKPAESSEILEKVRALIGE